MSYHDAPNAETYPVRVLACGHSKPVDPETFRRAEASPGAVTVWCRTCALNVHIPQEQQP